MEYKIEKSRTKVDMELLEKYFSIEESNNIINRLQKEKQRVTYKGYLS